jgi:hypothetical protein
MALFQNAAIAGHCTPVPECHHYTSHGWLPPPQLELPCQKHKIVKTAKAPVKQKGEKEGINIVAHNFLLYLPCLSRDGAPDGGAPGADSVTGREHQQQQLSFSKKGLGHGPHEMVVVIIPL